MKKSPLVATCMALCCAGALDLIAHGAVGAVPTLTANGDREGHRAAQADGVNSLYLLLRILDRPVSYAKVQTFLSAHGPRASVSTLCEGASHSGLRLIARTCTPADLAPLGMPVIVYMNAVRESGGRFVLLYGVPTGMQQKYGLIEAGTAEITEISVDDFRRSWSGIVLIPSGSTRTWHVALIASLFAMIGYCCWRSRLWSTRTAGSEHSDALVSPYGEKR